MVMYVESLLHIAMLLPLIQSLPNNHSDLHARDMELHCICASWPPKGYRVD